MKLIKCGDGTIRRDFENRPMIRCPVKATEVRSVKRAVGKPDLGKGGERLIQGSDGFKRGAAQSHGEKSDSQDRYSDEPKNAIFAVNVHTAL